MWPSPRWRKVWRDLWFNRSRSLLVVFSIALGVFAIGAVAHLYIIVARDLVASYAEVEPAQIVIYTLEGFDQDVVASIARLPQVRIAEGRRSVTVRFKLKPEDDWHPLQLYAVADYDAIRIDRIVPEKLYQPDPELWPTPGVWPPPRRAVVLERTSVLLGDLGIGRRGRQGDNLIVEVPDGPQRLLPMAGLCYDFSSVPATFAGRAYGYVTFDTLQWMGLARDYNELRVVVNGDGQDWDYLKGQASVLRARVERAGYTVLRAEAREPGKLPLDNQFRAITSVLGALGVFVLFLAVFLVLNTIMALLRQQVREIGVMKAVGAQTGQIVILYCAIVVGMGVLAFLIAVPAASYVAHEAINVMSYFINFSLTGFDVPVEVLLFEAAVGILVPLLAALWPILSGAQITVREAVASYGLSTDTFGSNPLDRLLESIRWLSRPLLLSLRNAFRRKLRLALTLITLALSGAVFMAVLSVQGSLNATLDEVLSYWHFDVQLQLARPYRLDRLLASVRDLPGVTGVEGWGGAATYRIRPDASESAEITLFAPPADSLVLQPQLVAGRWLTPEDQNALVIGTSLRDQESDLGLGASVMLRLDGRDTEWVVVGIVKTIGTSALAYANYPYFALTMRDVGIVTTLQFVTNEHTPAYQAEMAQKLVEHFDRLGIDIASKWTTTEQRAQSAVFFNIIVTLLMIMAVLMGTVGGLGLAGTMSLNVLERKRELGVMRAIGASDDDVLQIVIGEGVTVGVLSWLLSVSVAWPLGWLLSYIVGMQFFGTPLSFAFSGQSVWLWLGIVLALAVIATYFPAQSATRLTVREVLSYE